MDVSRNLMLVSYRDRKYLSYTVPLPIKVVAYIAICSIKQTRIGRYMGGPSIYIYIYLIHIKHIHIIYTYKHIHIQYIHITYTYNIYI